MNIMDKSLSARFLVLKIAAARCPDCDYLYSKAIFSFYHENPKTALSADASGGTILPAG